MIRILVRNDQVIVVLILSLLFNISFQLSNGFAVYYFKYVVGVEEQVAAYLTAAGIAQLCGLFGYPLLASRVGRKAVFSASGFFPIAGFAFLLFGVLPEQALSRAARRQQAVIPTGFDAIYGGKAQKNARKGLFP